MGVYIPKMILPQDCEECPFFMDEDFTWCGRCNYNICDGLVERKGKPSWCDLVELPPHGRLIDADALIRQMNQKVEETNNVRYAWVNEMDISLADTIIEAEEKDD